MKINLSSSAIVSKPRQQVWKTILCLGRRVGKGYKKAMNKKGKKKKKVNGSVVDNVQ